MTIPVMKPWLGADEAQAAADAVASGWVAQGPRVAAFEQAVADRVGAQHGVALSSCTTALHLALVLLGIGPGDEVIVPSLSFIATANAVIYIGATPVFADVELSTQNLSAETIKAVVTPRTRAVVLVHQAGIPADIDTVHALCDPLGVAVVEDAACAIGASYRGRAIGGHTELATLSFHPRKVITTGEGGMLLTSRDEWAARAKRLREHGMTLSAAARHERTDLVLEEYDEVGFNYRMTDIQAAVGLVQLEKLDSIVARRRELADRYRHLLADLDGAMTAADPPYGQSNFQSFWVLLPDDFPITRNELLMSMAAAGISGRRGIMAAHREPAYAGRSPVCLPCTEHLTDRSLILPMFHEMTEGEQVEVVNIIRKEAGLSLV
jgi:perosamine synthetase